MGGIEWNIKRNFRLIWNISQCQILLYLLFHSFVFHASYCKDYIMGLEKRLCFTFLYFFYVRF